MSALAPRLTPGAHETVSRPLASSVAPDAYRRAAPRAPYAPPQDQGRTARRTAPPAALGSRRAAVRVDSLRQSSRRVTESFAGGGGPSRVEERRGRGRGRRTAGTRDGIGRGREKKGERERERERERGRERESERERGRERKGSGGLTCRLSLFPSCPWPGPCPSWR